MPDDLRMTFGPIPDGRKVAIISRGGHPQIPGSGECEVLDLKACKNMKEAKAWFREAKAERMWETRQ